MSLKGNVGASAAAGEIQRLVENKIKDYQAKEVTDISKEELLNVLETIKNKAKSIVEQANTGWY